MKKKKKEGGRTWNQSTRETHKTPPEKEKKIQKQPTTLAENCNFQ